MPFSDPADRKSPFISYDEFLRRNAAQEAAVHDDAGNMIGVVISSGAGSIEAAIDADQADH